MTTNIATPSELLSPSLIEDFQNHPEYIIRKIVLNTKHIKDKLGLDPSDAAVLAAGIEVFRPDSVEKPVLLQHLRRWDRRKPEIVFGEGFRPWSEPQEEKDYDLYRHMMFGGSIFVSTFRSDQGDEDIRFDYEDGILYDIYAYGGIDLNIALGEENDFPDQREISFPGGIQRQFIKGASLFIFDNGTRVFSKYVENPDWKV